MSLKYLTGRPRDIKGATIDALSGALAASGDSPVLLLVPEQYTLQAELDVMDALNLPGSFRLQVMSPARLYSRIFERAGRPAGTRIDERGRVMMMYAALKQMKRDLVWYHGAQRRPGFTELAVSQISEFKQSGLTAGDIESLADTADEGPIKYKLMDIATVWRAYDEMLAGRFLDGEDEVSLALGGMNASDLLRGASVWVYGFELISATLARVIIAMAGSAEQVTVTLALEDDESAPDHHIFEPARRSLDSLSRAAREAGLIPSWEFAPPLPSGLPGDIAALERELYGYSPTPSLGRPKAVRLAALKNPMDEALFAASLTRRLVMSRGWRWRDIAVGLRSTEEYAEPLERAFSLYNVPLFLESSRPASRHPAAKYMLGALRFISKGLTAADAEALMRTGYSGLDDDECDILTNYAIKNGISGGRWRREFTRGGDSREAAESLRLKLISPILPLESALRAAKDISGQLRAIWGFMEGAGAYEALKRDIEWLNRNNLRLAANSSAQIWNRIVETLNQMNELVGDRRLPLGDLYEMLSQSLAASEVKPLPQSGDAVEAGQINRLRTHGVKALILVGMSDPGSSGEDGLFMREEREFLLGQPGVWLGPDASARKQLMAVDVKGALALAGKYVVITYPISDSAGGAASPGELPEGVKRIFPDIEISGGVAGGSREMRRMRLGAPRAAAIEISRGLRRGGEDGPLLSSALGALRSMPEHANYTSTIERALAARVSSDPIGRKLAAKLYGGPRGVSVSRLEKYAACPFQHFVSYGLRPEITKPFEFNPLDRGTFVHDALERFMKESDTREDLDASMARMDEITDALLGDVSDGPLSDSPVMLASARRLRKVARRAATIITRQFEGSRFAPRAIEVDFGELAPAVQVGDINSPVDLCGRIDRIDQSLDGDGWLRVVDYKTGAKRVNMADLYFGLQLQLIIYLAVALKWENGRPAGVFYFHADDPPIDTQERDAGKVERERESALRLDGLYIGDREVIDAMSPDAEGVIKLTFNKDGTIKKNTNKLSEEEFYLLIDCALGAAAEITGLIKSGVTGIYPVVSKGRDQPCKYCEYQAVCQIDPYLPGGEGERMRVFARSGVTAKDAILNGERRRFRRE